MSNAAHKAGGGDIRIENRKLDWKREGRTDALNSSYKPGGGDKRVIILNYIHELLCCVISRCNFEDLLYYVISITFNIIRN